MARLVAVGWMLDGKEFELSGEAVIGRSEDCEVVVPSPRASRRHARIFRDNDGFVVEDLKSKNGVLINSRAVTRHVLHDGDEVLVGEQSFIFRGDTKAQPRPPKIASPFAQGKALRHRSVGESGVAVVPGVPEDLSSHNVNLSMRIDLKDLEAQEAPAEGTEEMKRSHERLTTMIGVSNALSTIHDLGDLLDQVMKLLFSIFPQAERGFVMLGDEETGELVPQVIKLRGEGPDDEMVDGKETITISTAVMDEVLSGPSMVLCEDTASDDRFSDRMSIVNLQIRSMMCVPLVVRDEVLGVLHIDTTSRVHCFTEDDLQLLTGVAAQAAIAIKNARLVEQVQQEAATRGQLQRYLSPDLVDRFQRGEMNLDLGAVKGTVFFSDIIGFTKMSEQMPAAEVVAFLNRYFHIMEEIIFRNGGTIDKFGGDSIMAFWGVLVKRERDALDAVTAAVEMQNALFAFNCELTAQGHRSIEMGIGLNTGEFVAGEIGSGQKVEFTVIGDAVNLAQRIEDKASRGQVLISPSTYEQAASEIAAVTFPPVGVKGKTEPVAVYNVRSLRPPAASGRKGMILTIPVEISTDRAPDETEVSAFGKLVWGRVRTEDTVEIEVAAARRLCSDSVCRLSPVIQGLPDIPDIEARVLYSAEPSDENPEGSGGAMLLAENAPREFLRLLEPGSRIEAAKSLDEIGRS